MTISDAPIISPDILIVREGNCYRLLHGHLRLANILLQSEEVAVAVQEEGLVTITKTRNGYMAGNETQRLPLY
ncbi:MAG TPA: hypothetical protein VFF81_12590 [Noviherbaspirillum sp.]|nr:hypothetical protein [Noviherbaspirillum sp.]